SGRHLPQGARRALQPGARRPGEPARDHEVARDLRLPRERDGRVRGRRERAGRHRPRVRMTALVCIIALALVFDFINGFHDAANSIATVVSTRVLSPRWAVVWAAVFNFLAAFGMGLAVAKTISSGLVDPKQVTQYVIIAALAGAIIWDLLTWWWGLPTSSSHALIGGLAGAAIARAGWQVLVRAPKLHWPIIGTIPGLGAKWMSTLIFIVLAPLIGLLIGLTLMVAVSWIFQRTAPRTVDKLFRKLQLLSAA